MPLSRLEAEKPYAAEKRSTGADTRPDGLLVDPFGLHESRSNRAICIVSGGMAGERTRILATVISHRSDAVRSDNMGVEIH